MYFFNNSKVIKARIPLDNAVVMYNQEEKRIIWWELFYIWIHGDWVYTFMVKPWSKLKIWSICIIWEYILTIVGDWEYGRLISFDGDIFTFLSEYGQMPLPPYIGYQESKESLYQPVFAKQPWSIASPTASLHFTSSLLNQLASNGVLFDYITLHVGIGTFRTIKVKDIHDYDIHSEICEIDNDLFSRIAHYKQWGKNIIAVGTTSCRTLESLLYLRILLDENQKNNCCKSIQRDFRDSLAWNINKQNNYIQSFQIKDGFIQFECKLFITPWFQFTIIDQLITNFHLPKSSLMVLVASILGYEYMMNAYKIAIEKNYMFYSFGDAMWIYE